MLTLNYIVKIIAFCNCKYHILPVFAIVKGKGNWERIAQFRYQRVIKKINEYQKKIMVTSYNIEERGKEISNL